MYFTYILSIIIITIIFCHLIDNNLISERIFIIYLILSTLALILLSFFIFNKLINYLKDRKFIYKYSVLIIIEIYILINIIFSHIYFLLFFSNHLHFKGMEKLHINNYFRTYIFFFYFSNSLYFTIGFGDIYPQGVATRFTAILHMVIAYILSIYYFAKIAQNMTIH